MVESRGKQEEAGGEGGERKGENRETISSFFLRRSSSTSDSKIFSRGGRIPADGTIL